MKIQTSQQLLPKGRVLLVIPGDLHAKTLAAAQEQWHIQITPIESPRHQRRPAHA